MKPNIPWTARFAAWCHETFIGHRVTKTFNRGRYRSMECRTCDRTFHYTWS
jgi:hypothetical protein